MLLIDNVVVKFGTFPNGERNLNFNTICFHSNSTVILKYESDQDLFDLYILKRYMDQEIKDNKIGLLITYMPYCRMDRANEVYTFNLKFVADFINRLNFNDVTVVEPHSDVTPALLNNAYTFTKFTSILFKRFMDIIKPKDFVVMYPDAGAEKRYSKTFCYPTVVGMKQRDFSTGEIVKYDVIGADVNGKDVVIIDDLCSRGGTFIGATQALKELGAKNVYLIVTHCENNVYTGDLFKHITKMFTTNSLLTKYNIDFIDVTNVYIVKEKY